MSNDELTPGRWPNLSGAAYRRLVQLAESRLSGYGAGAAAEDVVSQAVMKWRTIPADKEGIARIEQVIKSESASWRRAEDRRRARESRHASDPSTAVIDHDAEIVVEIGLLVSELEATASKAGVDLTEEDRAILSDLLTGTPLLAIARQRGQSRYRIQRSRNKWRRAWQQTMLPAGTTPFPPTPSRYDGAAISLRSAMSPTAS